MVGFLCEMFGLMESYRLEPLDDPLVTCECSFISRGMNSRGMNPPPFLRSAGIIAQHVPALHENALHLQYFCPAVFATSRTEGYTLIATTPRTG